MATKKTAMSFAAEVFNTLRKVNCQQAGYTEEKYGLTYLKWSMAVDILLTHYPESEWEFAPIEYQPNGMVMVHCRVTVRKGDYSVWRTMHLACTDHKNRGIPNPDMHHVNTTMMRCLVKCIAMHGLGLSIYSGHPEPINEQVFPEAKEVERAQERINKLGIGERILTHYNVANVGDLKLAEFDEMLRGVDSFERKKQAQEAEAALAAGQQAEQTWEAQQ